MLRPTNAGNTDSAMLKRWSRFKNKMKIKDVDVRFETITVKSPSGFMRYMLIGNKTLHERQDESNMEESQLLHYRQCMEYYRDIEELPDNVRFQLLKNEIMEKIAKQTGDKGKDKNLKTLNWLLDGIRETNTYDQATLFGELQRRMSADEYCLKAMAILAMPQFTYLLSKAFMLHNVETGNASLAQLLSALRDKPIQACMTVDATVQRVEAWLQMAAEANGVTVQQLFNAIIGVFEKKHPKKNFLWLQGLPNSGKTTMMLYFASLYQKIGRPDGQSEFFWQNMYGKRIYLCDEFEMVNTTSE